MVRQYVRKHIERNNHIQLSCGSDWEVRIMHKPINSFCLPVFQNTNTLGIIAQSGSVNVCQRGKRLITLGVLNDAYLRVLSRTHADVHRVNVLTIRNQSLIERLVHLTCYEVSCYIGHVTLSTCPCLGDSSTIVRDVCCSI